MLQLTKNKGNIRKLFNFKELSTSSTFYQYLIRDIYCQIYILKTAKKTDESYN